MLPTNYSFDRGCPLYFVSNCLYTHTEKYTAGVLLKFQINTQLSIELSIESFFKEFFFQGICCKAPWYRKSGLKRCLYIGLLCKPRDRAKLLYRFSSNLNHKTGTEDQNRRWKCFDHSNINPVLAKNPIFSKSCSFYIWKTRLWVTSGCIILNFEF